MSGDVSEVPLSDQYKRLFDGILDGAIVLDVSSLEVVLANKAAADILGFAAPQEIIGQILLKHIPEDDWSAIARMISVSLEGKGKNLVDIRVVTKDKREAWVSATATMIEYEGRMAALVSLRDITTDKAKDAALRAAEESKMRLIDASSEAIAIVQDGKVVYVNPAGATGAGVPQQQMIGLSFLDFVHADERQVVSERYERLLAGEWSSETHKIRLVDAKGQIMWAEIKGMPYSWQEKPAVMLLLEDVTHKVRAQEALEEREERLRAVVENAWDGIFIFDENYHVIFFSPSLSRITGYTPEEWTERTPDQWPIHPDDLAPMAAQLEILRSQSGSTIADIRIRFKHKDGSWRTAEATGHNLLHDPKVKGIVVNFRDITERKRTEEALRTSEERNRLLIENANEGITVVQDAVLKFINPKFAEVTGYTTSDLVNRPFAEFIHPDDQQMLAEYYVRRMRGEQVPATYQFRFLTKAGVTRWAEINAVLFEWEGRPATLGMLSDITERKLAEEALRQSENRFRQITENMLDAISLVDLNGTIKYVSPSHQRILGYTSEDMVGKSVFEFIPPEDIEGLMASLEGLREKGEVTYQYRFRHSEGRYIWGEASAKAIRDDGGNVSGYVIASKDITDRKKAEELLKDSEAKYRRLFESTQTAIEVISAETGLVVLANEATARMFGFASPDDLVGLDSMAYLQPEDREWVAEGMAGALTDKSWHEIAELQVRTNDGRWLWISGMAIQSEYQGKPALLVSLLDITSRKQAEETLRQSEEQYRLLAEKTDDIIYTTDLDFNNTYISPSVERILGFKAEEYLARRLDQRMTPESLTRAQQVLLEHLSLEKDPKADPNRTVRIELEFYCKDGSTAWLEHQVSGIRDANGIAIGLHGVARDVSERRKAEQALRASEEKYRLLAEKTNDVIWTTGLDLRTNYISPSVERILGFTPEQILGQDFAEQMTPESVAQAKEALAGHLALEQDPTSDPNRTLRIELEYYHKNGSTVWLEHQVSGTRDVSGKLVGFHGVARDITERRKAEQELKDSERKYRLLAENTNELIWMADLNLHPTYMSPSAERIMGFTPEESLKMDLADTTTPESLAAAQEVLLHHLALEKDSSADPNRTLILELEFYRKDGSTVWLEEHVSGIRDAKGTLVGFHGVAHDVTERRKAQQALKESEERYRLLIENAAEAIVVVQDGLVKFVNPKGAELVGRSGEEMTSTPFPDYIHPDDRQMMMDNYLKRLAGEDVPNNYTFRMLDRPGNVRWIQINAVRIDWEGKPAVMSMLNDITDRVKTQEALLASEMKYRDLFEQTMMGMEVVDGQTGKVLLANHAISKMFGFSSPEEMVGLDAITGWVMPEDMEWVLQGFARAMADPNKREVATVRVKGKDGHTVWVSGSGTSFDYEGKPAILISVVDVTAAKESQDKLSESEEKNRLLIDVAAEGIAVIQNGMTKLFNRRLVELTAWTPEELLAKSFLDLVHPDEREMIALNYMKRVAGEYVPNNYVFRIIDGQNNVKWLQANAVRLNWEGKPATLTMFSDVTERVKVQEELKGSEERYRLLAENASDIIWVADLDLKITYASPAVSRLLGYTAEEISAGPFLDRLLTPESLASMTQLYKDDLADEKSRPGSWKERTVEIEAVSKDGSKYWLEAAISEIRDPEGRLIGFQGACRNITERKQAEESLRRSEERFRGLVEASSDWVWEMDRNSRYTYVSPKVRDILGYEPEELLGHTPYEFMHQREGRRVAKIVRRFADAQLPFSLLENTCVHKDGHSVVLETSAVPILDSDGSLIGYRGIDRDITERKKVEQELQHSLRRLEKTMESTIEAITTTIETRDPYTTGHQMRVTDLACAIAKVMELPPSQIEGIRVAGLLHDIGKIAIPTEILSKPGKLNEVEYEMIKTHSNVGYNILKKIEFPWPVARTVLQHHERWDGSGYPHGIRGEDILVEARILAVADVIEAMSSHRPYRASLGADKALGEIAKNSGVLYDPAVVNACVTAFAEGGFKFAQSSPEATSIPSTSRGHSVRSQEEH